MVIQHLLVSLIPLLPLLGFLFIALHVHRLAHRTSALIASAAVLISFILSAIVFLKMLAMPESERSFAVNLFTWINTGGFSADIAFLIDPLSSVMLLVITGVGFLIHVYSIGYMHDDAAFSRFFSYLNLFVFFMLILVMSSNYLLMFVGWEGVGLCSYLLIGFWFKNHDYNQAANKAFIMNRIGDLGLLLGVILIFVTYGTLDYGMVLSDPSKADVNTITAITLLLFIGAMGKSAQIPLYTWLPDAMAGPTPVSALIHAATMVTAGVYMVVRNNAIYSLAPVTMEVIVIIGLSTALLAATIAIAQNDIKKVLAYSTVSQLGLMFVALGLGAYSTGIFHMVTHAFFKALLFLSAGSVIHALGGEQDIRRMGGMKTFIPLTTFCFFVGVLAISGIPPFSGFFSKDEILAQAFAYSPIVWALVLITSLLTVGYMFRLFFLTFMGVPRAAADVMNHVHESPRRMTIPLLVLAMLAFAGGFINIPEVLFGSAALHQYLAPLVAPAARQHHLAHSTEYLLMLTVLVLTLVVIFFTYTRYVRKSHVPGTDTSKAGLPKLLLKKYYVDEIYETTFVRPLGWLSRFADAVVEKLAVDRIVNTMGSLVPRSSEVFRRWQTGSIGFYIFVMVIGIIAILTFTTLRVMAK